MIDDVVVGGGIAALMFSWCKRVPVVVGQLSPPPLCAFLHDTSAGRSLLQELEIPADRRPISNYAVWNGEWHAFPSPQDALDAYFRKTRMRDVETTAFDKAKGESSQWQIAPMSRVFIEMFLRLKMEGLVVDRTLVSLTKVEGGWTVCGSSAGKANHYVTAKNVHLACPPDIMGFPEQQVTHPEVRNVYDYFEVGDHASMVDILYLCDPADVAYRINYLGCGMVLVEHTIGVDDAPASVLDVTHCVARHYQTPKRHLGRTSNFGYYERKYDLPSGIHSVGRAATGIPLLTTHLYEALKNAN